MIVALTGALGSRTPVAPAPVVTMPAVVVTAREPHPEIMAGIRSLERAKAHLEHAAHDFHGHRVAAIGAINAAIAQLQECLTYDQ
jgi:hypothetical protein